MEEIREGYKKTEIGVIPEDWEVKRLEEYFDFFGGYSIARSGLSKTGDYYLHYGDIHKRNRSYINTAEDEYWLPKVIIDREKEGARLDTGDVVIADASEDIEGVGKSVAIEVENREIVAGLHTIVAKDKSEYLDLKYKRYFLGSVFVRKQFNRLATGSKVYGITKSNLMKINIPLPPLEEQKKIADILSSIDGHIEGIEDVLEDYKLLKKGMMQELLTNGIGHSEFKDSEVGRIPKSWEVKRFKDISKVSQGLQISISERFKEKRESRLPYITIQYLNNIESEDNRYFVENASKNVTCHPDDVLMTRTGNTGIVVTGEYGVFHNNFFKIDFQRDLINRLFLVYYLKSIRKLVLRYAGTSTIPDLNHKDFYTLPMIIPPLEEQKKIADILSSIDDYIEGYENELERYRELKKGLMQVLLTGEKRVI